MFEKAVGPDGHRLAVRCVQARQLHRQRGDASRLATAVGRDHSSLHPRAPLGDYKAIRHELLIEHRKEDIAGDGPLRGQPVHQAHRQQQAGVQRRLVGLWGGSRRDWRSCRRRVLRLGAHGWRGYCRARWGRRWTLHRWRLGSFTPYRHRHRRRFRPFGNHGRSRFGLRLGRRGLNRGRRGLGLLRRRRGRQTQWHRGGDRNGRLRLVRHLHDQRAAQRTGQ